MMAMAMAMAMAIPPKHSFLLLISAFCVLVLRSVFRVYMEAWKSFQECGNQTSKFKFFYLYAIVCIFFWEHCNLFSIREGGISGEEEEIEKRVVATNTRGGTS